MGSRAAFPGSFLRLLTGVSGEICKCTNRIDRRRTSSRRALCALALSTDSFDALGIRCRAHAKFPMCQVSTTRLHVSEPDSSSRLHSSRCTKSSQSSLPPLLPSPILWQSATSVSGRKISPSSGSNLHPRISASRIPNVLLPEQCVPVIARVIGREAASPLSMLFSLFSETFFFVSSSRTTFKAASATSFDGPFASIVSTH
mmetsp:Transcript_18813/g.54192  ORF Transcript_18813/g.54192 Transcript_18813/m.54192 type:complete len:201 (+) Transcript_18813:252-854(+)